ncbi:hypothetical protein BC567DRAFT_48646 [Phyllosticta citribraziliensis]
MLSITPVPDATKSPGNGNEHSCSMIDICKPRRQGGPFSAPPPGRTLRWLGAPSPRARRGIASGALMLSGHSTPSCCTTLEIYRPVSCLQILCFINLAVRNSETSRNTCAKPRRAFLDREHSGRRTEWYLLGPRLDRGAVFQVDGCVGGTVIQCCNLNQRLTFLLRFMVVTM